MELHERTDHTVMVALLQEATRIVEASQQQPQGLTPQVQQQSAQIQLEETHLPVESEPLKKRVQDPSRPLLIVEESEDGMFKTSQYDKFLCSTISLG